MIAAESDLCARADRQSPNSSGKDWSNTKSGTGSASAGSNAGVWPRTERSTGTPATRSAFSGADRPGALAEPITAGHRHVAVANDQEHVL